MKNKEVYSLTNAQKQIIDMYEYGGKETVSIATSFFLDDKYNYDILNRTINEIIRKNDALRIKIIKEDGVTKQTFCDEERVEVEVFDFNSKEEYLSWARKEARKGMSIDERLYMFCGYRIGEKWGVFMKFHHVITDARSLSIIYLQIKQ
ncbi:MAG: condensation domain-containing protein, partial [Ruminiclostridium sp.]